MKRNTKRLLLPFVVALTLISGGCDDWTSTESLEIGKPEAPANYEKYLEKLRSYRASDHKIVYVQFENIERPTMRADHLTTIPDSVDIISLNNPDKLPAWIQAEMAELQEKKAMKFIREIDFAAIEDAYALTLPEGDEMQTADVEASGEGSAFAAFCRNYMASALATIAEYGYDGVSLCYAKRITGEVTAEEALVRQKVFFDEAFAWFEANGDKMLLLDGAPQELEDRTRLNVFAYIVVRAFASTTVNDYTAKLNEIVSYGVTGSNVLIGVTTPSLDGEHSNGLLAATGADGKAVYATVGAAQWCREVSAGYTRSGIMIADVRNDYFNPDLIYKNTRAAIETMNPSF